MVRSLLLSAFAFYLPLAHAISFSAHTCSDQKKVIDELIRYEVSGGRWQGGISRCLKQWRFQTLFAKRQDSGDAKLLQPEYILTGAGEVKIISKKEIPDLDAIEVEFGYLARKFDPKQDQKENFIKDRLVYRLNDGRNREKMGCVGLVEEPEHLVMKEECLKK